MVAAKPDYRSWRRPVARLGWQMVVVKVSIELEFDPAFAEIECGQAPALSWSAVVLSSDVRVWHIATNPKAQNLRSVLMQSGHLRTSGLGEPVANEPKRPISA
jgi:hypothetical protein